MPHQGASNEYPQHIFSWRNKKNIYRIPPLSRPMAKQFSCQYRSDQERIQKINFVISAPNHILWTLWNCFWHRGYCNEYLQDTFWCKVIKIIPRSTWQVLVDIHSSRWGIFFWTCFFFFFVQPKSTSNDSIVRVPSGCFDAKIESYCIPSIQANSVDFFYLFGNGILSSMPSWLPKVQTPTAKSGVLSDH